MTQAHFNNGMCSAIPARYKTEGEIISEFLCSVMGMPDMTLDELDAIYQQAREEV